MRNKKYLYLLVALVFALNIPRVTARGYRTKVIPCASGFTNCYLKLAPDGEKVALAYFKNGKHYVRINNKVYGGYEIDDKTIPFIKFSPDSKTFSFIYQKKGRSYLQINDQRYGAYTKVNLPIFSETGKNVCFRYAKGKKWYLWLNGKRYGGYQAVGVPMFTADDTGFGFAYRKWWKWYFNINRQKYGSFEQCWGPFLSSDGNHFGFIGQKGGKGEVYYYLDGERYGPVDLVKQFSCNSEGQSFDVFYEKEGKSYLQAAQNQFGPFSEVEVPQVGVGEVDIGGGIVYRVENEKFLQYGANNFGGYCDIGPVFFGPRQKLWGFCYRKKDGYYVRIGRRDFGPYPAAVIGPYFSPNEKAYAFWYRAKRRIYINVNNRIYTEKDSKDFAFLELVSGANGWHTGYKYRQDGREFVRVGKMVYGGRGHIYSGSLTMSQNGICFGYRYRYQEQDYVQMNEKVFKCGMYQTADFVITPNNRACFARYMNGRIVIQEINYD
jgi:hypothetical protein